MLERNVAHNAEQENEDAMTSGPRGYHTTCCKDFKSTKPTQTFPGNFRMQTPNKRPRESSGASSTIPSSGCCKGGRPLRDKAACVDILSACRRQQSVEVLSRRRGRRNIGLWLESDLGLWVLVGIACPCARITKLAPRLAQSADGHSNVSHDAAGRRAAATDACVKPTDSAPNGG